MERRAHVHLTIHNTAESVSFIYLFVRFQIAWSWGTVDPEINEAQPLPSV